MAKCPFCGAESSESSINLGAIKAWACGTNYAQRRHYHQSKGKTLSAACSALFRSEDCYNRQIAQQAERIADLERRLENAEKRLDFDRRVDIHFQSHVSNSSGETIKLGSENKRWTATIYDQWSILPEQVVGAKTLEELLTLPELEAVRTQSVETKSPQ